MHIHSRSCGPSGQLNPGFCSMKHLLWKFLLPPWNAWNGCKSSPRVPPAVMSQYPFIHMDEVRESGTKLLVYENIAMGRLSE